MRGSATNTNAQLKIAGQKLDGVNGSVPPSGNATTSASAGAIAAAPSQNAIASRVESSHASAMIPRNSPATGLASVVATASSAPSAARRWVSASRAARPNVTPRPNVRRPVMRFIAVAAANHSAPTHARAPHCSRARRSNSTALQIAHSAPASRGPSTAPSGGNSTL